VTYSVQWIAAWAVFIVGAICGVLAGADRLGAHPSWLTPDLAATATIVAAVCGILAAVLPQLQRTPAVREARYISALAGSLPDDVAQKHGLMTTQQPDGSLTVVSPEQPPPH
jgi:hypothetical protein